MGQKIAFLLLISILRTEVKSQELIRPGLFRTHFTISPSYVFSPKEGDFHFHGAAEVFVTSKFSIAGDGFFFLGQYSGGNSIFDYNHSVFWGGNFHWTNNNSDFYLGLQPGIAITKLDAERNNLAQSNSGTNPVLAGVIGFNQFISPYFHFFVQSRLVIGQHVYDKPMNLTEVKLSAGLGFNLGLFQR